MRPFFICNTLSFFICLSLGLKIVIGSWGSYNECNERALGSKWLDLSDYSDWDKIVEELKKEGFELDGIYESKANFRKRSRRGNLLFGVVLI